MNSRKKLFALLGGVVFLLTFCLPQVLFAAPQVVSSKIYTLSIPKIKVLAPVISVGIGADGRMGVPNNYTQVGLLSTGVKPGEKGSAVLAAHVDNGGRIPGVFKNLKTLRVGDDIYTTDASGQTLHFKVAEMRVYDKNSTDTGSIFSLNDSSHLNLITCYGLYLPKEKTYSNRLVVFAEKVNV